MLQQIKRKYSLGSKILYKKNHFGECFSLYLGMPLLLKMFEAFPESMERKKEALIYKIHFKNNCQCGELKTKKSKTCLKCKYKNSRKQV